MQQDSGVPSIVKLNVSGNYFTVCRETRFKDHTSKLAAMFSSTFETRPCEDSAFFMDQDGTRFLT